MGLSPKQKNTVQSAKGKIGVPSREDQLSTFTIRLNKAQSAVRSKRFHP